ncbi:helix-turn-helix transcriptional regulator [Brevibacterium ammoniilyticum]
MTLRPARQTPLWAPSSGSPVSFTGHDFHTHDHPLLVHVVSGSVVIDIARRGDHPDQRIVADAGTGVWLGTGVEHAVAENRDSILIGPRLSPGTQPPNGCLRISRFPELHDLTLRILAASPRSAEDKHVFRVRLDALLNGLVEQTFALPQPSHRTVAEIVESPLALVLPLGEVARAHALSPRHIERLFRADLGLRFVEWRTRARLNRALAHIRAGATLRSAARAVGYASADGLIKAAQRRTGLDREVLVADFVGALEAWHR